MGRTRQRTQPRALLALGAALAALLLAAAAAPLASAGAANHSPRAAAERVVHPPNDRDDQDKSD